MANVRHRKFTVKPVEDVEPLTFEVEFEKPGRSKNESEEFTCYPAIPGATILEFVSASAGEGNEMAEGILGFFEKALVPESWVRFNTLIKDPERVVDMGVLSEIIAYLIEQYSDRPTEASAR